MNGLFPIIRRVRRPLLPPDERAASVPLAVPAVVPPLERAASVPLAVPVIVPPLEAAPAPAPPLKPAPSLKRVAPARQRETEKVNG